MLVTCCYASPCTEKLTAHYALDDTTLFVKEKHFVGQLYKLVYVKRQPSLS